MTSAHVKLHLYTGVTRTVNSNFIPHRPSGEPVHEGSPALERSSMVQQNHPFGREHTPTAITL